MKTTTQEVSTKHCRECGCEIHEKVESSLYECERCIGMNEE
ncbi:YhfH family protein [Psychrobacillus sp. NPDC096389]